MIDICNNQNCFYKPENDGLKVKRMNVFSKYIEFNF